MLYEYSNKGRKISLINEAIVRKEGDFLRANKIFLSEEIDEGNTYHYGEAYDNIYFYSSKDKVKIFGDYGYWNEKNNEVYISGRVKIKKKKMIIIGNELWYYKNQGKIKMVGEPIKIISQG